jgi:hypothetical protein
MARAPKLIVGPMVALFLGLACLITCHLIKSTDMHQAARDNDVTKIHELVAAGASVEAQDFWKRTPLHWAASLGHAKAINVLVAAGASVEAQDFVKWTPLHSAASNGHADAIKVLLAAGASVEAHNTKSTFFVSKTPLHWAARGGHADAIRILEAADPLRRWMRAHELSETQHLPLLQSLGVDRLADVSILCGLTMDDLFSDIAWTSMPCAPHCSVVKVAVHKAINAECVPTKGGAKVKPIEVKTGVKEEL